MPPVQNQTPINKKLPQWAIYITEVLGILLCILVASASFFYWYDKNKVEQDALTIVAPISTSTQTLQTASWKTYRNDEYGFEFKYPVEWVNKGEYIDVPEGKEFNVKGQLMINIDVVKDESGEGSGFSLEDSKFINGFNTEIGYSFFGKNFYKLAKIQRNRNWVKIVLTYYSDSNFDRTEKDKLQKFYKENSDTKMIMFLNNLDQILSTFKFVSTSTPK